MFLLFWNFFLQLFLLLLLYMLLFISFLFNYSVWEFLFEDTAYVWLKLKIHFETCKPFCELQISSDQAQMHNHLQYAFLPYAYIKTDTYRNWACNALNSWMSNNVRTLSEIDVWKKSWLNMCKSKSEDKKQSIKKNNTKNDYVAWMLYCFTLRKLFTYANHTSNFLKIKSFPDPAT